MKNVSFVAMGAIAQQLLSFVVIILITHYLGTKGYGEIVTLTAISNTIFSFSAQWAQPYIVRTESISYTKTQKIGGAFFIPLFISLLILFPIVYIAINYFSNELGGINKNSALMVYCAAISYFIFQIAKIGFQIQGRFNYYGILLSLDKIILLIFLSALLLLNDLNSVEVLWAYICATALAGFSGLIICLYKRYEWSGVNFLYSEYIKSITPVSISVVIHYFSSITFLILIVSGMENARFVAWIGMGNVILGILLQPFVWLAPTLAPQLSRQILEADRYEKINNYLKNWVLSSNIIILWINICVVIIILFTPILPLLLGNDFQNGLTIIALVSLLATAEAANIMLVQVVYAHKLEKVIVLAVIIKAIPLLIGYFFNMSVEYLLIFLNIGSWLAIIIHLLAIRSYLERIWMFQYTMLIMMALLIPIITIQSYNKLFLVTIFIVTIFPIMYLYKKSLILFRLNSQKNQFVTNLEN